MALGTSALHAKPFVWTASADALSMDPYSTNNSFTTAFMTNIYEGLVRFNEQLKVEPALAESWTSVSPTVWRFKLRQGVKFHNGEAFTADDVVFSWQRVQSPGSITKLDLGEIKDMRKVDNFTVDVETKAPFPLVLNNLMSFTVMSKVWSEANNAREASDLQQKKENFANRNTNGTGPFMLKSREVDVKTVLAANPNWWDKPKHNLTEVTFTPIGSDATRTAVAAVWRAGCHRQRAAAGRGAHQQLRRLHRWSRALNCAPCSSAWTSFATNCCTPTSRARTRSRTCACVGRCTRQSTWRRSSARSCAGFPGRPA